MATSVGIPQGQRVNSDTQSTTHHRLPSSSSPSSSSRSPANPRRLAVGLSFEPSTTHPPCHPQTHALPHSQPPSASTATAPPYRAAALRASLTRRRSSYPPATTPGSSAGFSWFIGDGSNTGIDAKVNPDFIFDPNQSFGPFDTPYSGMAGMGWDGLINSDSVTPQRTPSKLAGAGFRAATAGSPKPNLGQAMSRALSEPGEQKDAAATLRPGILHGTARFAQSATDMAWKTILGSVVDVEGVGEVGVSRVLQEIWKRGGGDTVTAQNLWSSIIMALSLPSSAETSIRISAPSAHASTALQELYRLTLKHWEPAIFSGLLAQYSTPGTPTAAAPDIDFPSVSAPKYGASTPTREFDASFAQWTNVTPGLGGDFSALFGGSTGLTPRGSISHPSNLGQFEFHFDERPPLAEQPSGIDEILASMEEGQQADEREIVLAAATQPTPRDPVTSARPVAKALVQGAIGTNTNNTPTFQLPTPETDSDGMGHTPRSNQSERASHFSPDSMASPYVTGSSGTASAISKNLSMTTTANNTMLNAASAPVAGSSMSLNRTTSRAAHPTSLVMPTEAFVPPPPMCMFFNPSFRDLQQGKVGVWKGDLELKGTAGGTFSVLIVGEEVSGHLWQSHQWAPKLTHPPEIGPDTHTSPFTSKMIPVAYLAREGFTPVTMGMVLCNDDKIQAFVSMVQSMHSEGVAFHLPNPANLPIVFLPAKFDPHDQLQRLGIAYMTKPGAPIPGGLPKIARSRPTDAPPPVEPKRKKRRQSMPAKASVSPAQTKRRDTVVDTRGKNGTLNEEAEDGPG